MRSVAFQLHLWTGLLLALYVIVLSATGSLLVYRAELTRAFDDPSWTWGTPLPVGVRGVFWLVDLHDELLLGRENRFVNGIGSVVVTVLLATGMVVWWPGVQSWRRGLTVRWRARWPRLTWDLHSAGGFWLSLLLLNWSLTGIYLSFPSQTTALFDVLWPPADAPAIRMVDHAIEWALMFHFGRWSNPVLKAIWFVLGLTPALLGLTGAVLWWNRAGRRATRMTWPVAIPKPRLDRLVWPSFIPGRTRREDGPASL